MRHQNSLPIRHLFQTFFSTQSVQPRSVVRSHNRVGLLNPNIKIYSTCIHNLRNFIGPQQHYIRSMVSSAYSSNVVVSSLSSPTAAVAGSPNIPTSAGKIHDEQNKKAMDDEYGDMNAVVGHTYVYPGPFRLESGIELPHAQLRYMTYGTLNSTRDNVVVVCHALTGNANVHTWWGNMIGPGQALDTQKYFIVCANILGSCYGSTGPSSSCPHYATTQQDSTTSDILPSTKYGMAFPDVSVQDTVRLQLHMLQDELKVQRIKCVIGGSFGGMQALEFAVQAGTAQSPFAFYCPRVKQKLPWVQSVIPMACGAAHTAWQIAISEVQRQAIYADPKWKDGNPSMDDPPISGLSVARQIGMISYRTPKAYEMKFGRRHRADEKIEESDIATQDKSGKVNGTYSYGSRAQWQVKSYLEYQGVKFLSRFDPITYIKLTEQMDSHDVGRNRGGKQMALSHVRIPALVMGIDSDVLYPLWEQEELATLLPNSIFRVIRSDAGHDGFLLEQEQVSAHITTFLNSLHSGNPDEMKSLPRSKL